MWYSIIFYVFVALLLASALMVVLSDSPVKSVMTLVLAFFASAVLWMMMSAEFLSLALIFVYVGAVMTLFLYVVMMLNVNKIPGRKWRLMPLGVIIVGVVMIAIIASIKAAGLAPTDLADATTVNNTAVIGHVLYTQYVLAFEAVALVLLVAMISAIAIVFRGRRMSTKTQSMRDQVQADADRRVKLVDLKKKPAKKTAKKKAPVKRKPVEKKS